MKNGLSISVRKEKRQELIKMYAEYTASSPVKVSFSAFIVAAMEKGAAELLTEKTDKK